MSYQEIAYLAILIGAFALLVSEKLRADLVALLIVVALAVTGVLTPEQALAGFGNEAAIIAASVFVLAAGLQTTGVADLLGRLMTRLATGSTPRIVAVVMAVAALSAAVAQHLTATALLLSPTLRLAEERGLAPSKLVMPLSFGASLGASITLVGATSFVVASADLMQAGLPGLGLLTFAPVGLALALVGIVYMMILGPFLLPSRGGRPDAANRFRLDAYLSEVVVLDASPLIGKTLGEATGEERLKMDVVGLVRDGTRFAAQADERLQAQDVLVVRATPDQLVSIRTEPDIELRPIAQWGAQDAQVAPDRDASESFVQVVVAGGSSLVNRSLGEVDFRRRYGCVVVAVWRRSTRVTAELSRLRLRAGDVLVLEASEEAAQRLPQERDFLMMVPFVGEARERKRAPVAIAITALSIGAAALNLLPLQISLLAGAVGMVLTGCVRAQRAYRAIDIRVYVFIAGGVVLGTAMTQSGTAAVLAGWLQGGLSGVSTLIILLALYAVAGVLTQFLSDAATTALLAPVAIALGQGLGHPPAAYVVTVAMGAETAFGVPIAHEGSLLIYGLGHYRFKDFVRLGLPLSAIMAFVVAVTVRWLWQI